MEIVRNSGFVATVLSFWPQGGGFDPGRGGHISIEAECWTPEYSSTSVDARELKVAEIIRSPPLRRLS